MKKNRKNDVLWVIVGGFVLATFICSGVFLRELSTLNNAFTDLTKIEYLSSSTQRLVRLVNAGQSDTKLLFYIDEQTQMALDPSEDTSLSVLEISSYAVIASGVLQSWEQIQELIDAEDLDVNSLYLASDNHFSQMTDLSNAVGEYTTALNNKIIQVQSVITVLLSAVGLVILNNILRTHTELKQIKALAQVALIDGATGLFNRSKCQELFKTNRTASGKKHPAIVVLDLNDLKKTNDNQGHRVGDELIHSFASVLKRACNVHVVAPFIGRYGGDEFIIYYDDVESEEDIIIYLKELDFLTEDFNSKENKFKISYAAGFAVVTEDSLDKMTIRQLFDQADENMYANKIAMKKERDPNYDATLEGGR